MKKSDLTRHKIGDKFGCLTIVLAIPKSEKCRGGKKKRLIWLCKCDCGIEKWVPGTYLRTGKTSSCGCLAKKLKDGRPRKYSVSICSEPLMRSTYRSWMNMMQRCFNKKSIQYDDYGGRGITVCNRWIESFDNFLEDMGKKQELNLSIDRIDNNGNYEPDNCRWATMAQQHSNRRNSRVVFYDGEKIGLVELCRRLGKNYNSVGVRMYTGWSLEEALNTPVNHHKNKNIPLSP